MTWWGWMLAGIGAFMLLVMIIALPTILVGLFRHEKKYRKKNVQARSPKRSTAAKKPASKRPPMKKGK